MAANGMDLFQVRQVELASDTRLIATSNYNYALVHPRLGSKGWRSVSVNGDKITVSTLTGERQIMSRSAIGELSMSLLEQLRDEIANSPGGYSSTTSAGGSGSGFTSGNGGFMMSSNTGGGMGMSSTSFSSSTGGIGGTTMMSGGIGGMGAGGASYDMRDAENFSVSRSDFPFGWSKVFFNGDIVTTVARNGDVCMLPLNAIGPAELEAVNRIKSEAAQMQRGSQQQVSNTMQTATDMISNVFSSIMGSFPKPPSYQSAVGNTFGSSFPFGPNNSPFSSSSGWPFGGGGASAVAIAGRRRR